MSEFPSLKIPSLTFNGRLIPRSLLGELQETKFGDDLKSSFDDNGYLFIRQALARESVEIARRFVLQQLAEVDEIDIAIDKAVATGRSRRKELYPDLGLFWKRISEAQALRQCVHAESLHDMFAQLFQEPVKPFDFVWLRAFIQGRGSPLHIDHPYMNRGTRRVVSCWIPLGAVAIDGGPLFLIENSHRIRELRDEFEGHDVDLHTNKPGYISTHPIDFAQHYGLQLLSSAFEPGDVLVFNHFIAHASFDNGDRSGRVRLSCDTRWQPAGEPMDERFRGPSPGAHGGLGYGCLSSAQPLTAELARR